jgi:WD40 repeat protein
MRWPLAGVRWSKVNTGLLVAGAALLLVALLSRWVTVGSNQIVKGAPGWVPVVMGAVGVLAIGGAVAVGQKPVRWMRTSQGFLGAPPKMPDPGRLVDRPELSQQVAEALRARGRAVALIGTPAAGKSTLAAVACLDRRVRRRFRHGVTWLEARPGQDPVALLGDLGRRLGLRGRKSRFTTVKTGRDEIIKALRGKRVLVAVDNVWEPGPLDALIDLAEGCTVLFTTRMARLATQFNATPIEVNKLSEEQALELLGRWAGKAPAELPDAARALCTRVGNLALGVAMAGAMVAQDRSFTDVLALIEQDLARVHADLDPEYPYPNLRAAIEAGISDLPKTLRQQYEHLAVFAGHSRFPRDAAEALWSELAKAEVGDLLADLTGRSLLTAAGEGWYTAHDLQYDVLTDRLGREGLAVAHARLLDGYRSRYPGGWTASATAPYLASALAGHLHGADHDSDHDGELRAVLTDVEWIQARVAADGQLPGLLADYGYASDPLSQQIARALWLSAHILAADPGQVRGQLAGRLLGHPDPAVAAWATALTTHAGPGPWLAPLTPALTPTTTALQQVLTSHGGTVGSVAVTADGATAVSGSGDGTVQVWDLATGRQWANLPGHDGPVGSVAVTPDGATAVSGGSDGRVLVWGLATGTQRAKLPGHGGRVGSVAVTPDGATAVTGGLDDDTVRVWDPATGRQLAELPGHDGPVWAVAVTADGATAISGGGDGTVRVWDLATGRQLAELPGHDGPVFSVAVTPDGATAVSGGDGGTVRVWDLATGRQLAELPGHDGPVLSVAVTADGATAVSGGGDGTVRVWDLATGTQQAELPGHGGRVGSVAVTAARTTAVSGGLDDGAVRVWDLATGTQRAEHPGHGGLVESVAVTSDGATAVSGGDGGTVRVWDLATGRRQAEFPGHDGPVSSVAVTPDGATAVSGGGDGAVRVWDLATGTQRAEFPGHDGWGQAVESVAVTPDGATAVSGGGDGAVRVWDLATGTQRAELPGHDFAVSAVAVSADGATAVSGDGDGAVRVWDLATGTQRAEFPGHDGWVRAVAVTPDGATAVSGGGDGTVRVWDLATGTQRAEFPGHDRWVRAVAVAADGATAVSGGGYDGTVRVWDLAHRIELASWIGDFGVVACTVLPGQPLKIAVGQSRGRPYLLELRGQQNAP